MHKFRNSLQRIAELETRWNIHIIPHPRDRHFDELHNITLVALATEDNNNTVIICREVEEFRITSKETILTTIGKELIPYIACLRICKVLLPAMYMYRLYR